MNTAHPQAATNHPSRGHVRTPRLAVIPTLLPDEPLDRWLQLTAASMDATVAQLCRHLHMRSSGQVYHFVRDLTPDEFARLHEATGLPVTHLEAATLRRWRTLGLEPSRQAGPLGPVAWPNNSGARLCPECFAERGQRWRLDWYLQWSFVCTRHRTLMLTHCPTCTTRLHSHPTWAKDPRQHQFCSNGCQLSHDPETVTRIPAAHPFLTTQAHFAKVLNTTDPKTLVGGALVHPATWLNDVVVLCRAVIRLLFERDPTTALKQISDFDLQSELRRFHTRIPDRTGSTGGDFTNAARHAFTFAAATSIAIDILNERSVDAMRARLADLPAGITYRIRQHLLRDGHSVALMNASEGRLPQGRRHAAVRHDASRYTTPTHPGLVLADAVPARIFQNFTNRHHQELPREVECAAASAALLTGGDEDTLAAAARQLGLNPHSVSVLTTWRRLMRNDQDGHLLRDLLLMRQAIATGDCPIDFARRRHTYNEPSDLPHRGIHAVATETGRRHSPAFELTCALFVYERLSGSDALLSDRGRHLPGAFRLRYRATRRSWMDQPPAALELVAEKHLLRHRINEPMTWQPQAVGHSTWTCPAPVADKSLPGWGSRDLRGSSRRPAAAPLNHAPADDISAYARNATTPIARRAALGLRALDRLAGQMAAPGYATAYDRIPQSTIGAIVTLQEDLGRIAVGFDYSQSAADDDEPPIVLTEFGQTLIRSWRALPTHPT